MKCEECLPLLEEYFDGELDARTAALASAHLAACELCARAYQELNHEHEIYASYNREIKVSPALWAGVQAAIKEEGSVPRLHSGGRLHEWLVRLFATPRFSPSLTIAMLLIAVGLTIAVMRFSDQRRTAPDNNPVSRNSGPDTTAQPLINPAKTEADARAGPEIEKAGAKDKIDEGGAKQAEEARRRFDRRRAVAVVSAGQPLRARPFRSSEDVNRALTPDQLVREAEQKYLAAIAILARDVRRRRSRLDAETARRFEQTLAAVDRTIAGTRKAVRQHPGDPLAVQYMLAAYAKKVEVMREMASY
ncbi:MAG TPA: zf-HC2 domain-containing protein [Pyrinomonadaceae bacterium]|jgi:hypothetical protein